MVTSVHHQCDVHVWNQPFGTSCMSGAYARVLSRSTTAAAGTLLINWHTWSLQIVTAGHPFLLIPGSIWPEMHSLRSSWQWHYNITIFYLCIMCLTAGTFSPGYTCCRSQQVGGGTPVLNCCIRPHHWCDIYHWFHVQEANHCIHLAPTLAAGKAPPACTEGEMQSQWVANSGGTSCCRSWEIQQQAPSFCTTMQRCRCTPHTHAARPKDVIAAPTLL